MYKKYYCIFCVSACAEDWHNTPATDKNADTPTATEKILIQKKMGMPVVSDLLMLKAA